MCIEQGNQLVVADEVEIVIRCLLTSGRKENSSRSAAGRSIRCLLMCALQMKLIYENR
jgi:hypothetical protein